MPLKRLAIAQSRIVFQKHVFCILNFSWLLEYFSICFRPVTIKNKTNFIDYFPRSVHRIFSRLCTIKFIQAKSDLVTTIYPN